RRRGGRRARAERPAALGLPRGRRLGVLRRSGCGGFLRRVASPRRRAPRRAAVSVDTGAAGLPDSLVRLLDAAVDLPLRHRMPKATATARRSAVLILFGAGPVGPDVLLIEKSAHLRSHAGQPAFPGGGVDPDDDYPVGTALREAHEEGGIDPGGAQRRAATE